MNWNLAEAQRRLSEIVKRALSGEPQTITRERDAVVVISAERYAELTGGRRSFKDFLMSGPSFAGLHLERDKTPIRDAK